MSIVAALTTSLFIVLLALLTINSSFSSGRSDLGFFKSEKQDLLRFNQYPSNRLDSSDSDLPRRTLKAAYEQPKTNSRKQRLRQKEVPGFYYLQDGVAELMPLPLDNLTDLITTMFKSNFENCIKQLPWKNLQYLDLRPNLFEAPIPVPPPDMKVFLVSNNKLTGEIPHLICNMSTLQVLDLSDNSLTGTIPECMGHFSNSLRVLDLQENKFHGNIPGLFAKDNDLRTLNLNGNELKGPIQNSLLNCTKLEVLDLGNNNINESFPKWLGSLPALQVLVLRSNKFSGLVTDPEASSTSFSKLRIFYISNNNFNGLLPVSYFENMKSMMSVSGEVKKKPQYMGDRYYEDSATLVVKKLEVKLVKILTVFCTIDFSNNSFNGPIPEVIGKLLALNHLNLSQNSLTGQIPPSLGNLEGVEVLDLSSNKLGGRIPWQLTNLTFLSLLNLSQNQLVGRIPEVNQFGTFSSDSYEGNLGFCGLPLKKNCSSGEPSQPSPRSGDTDSEEDFGWKVVLAGYGCGTAFGLIIGCLVFTAGKPQWLVNAVEGNSHKTVRRIKTKQKRRRN
ncbi:receptor-like protein 33 [Pistacia vera]|uniref:receptor-like protein 33 n=1 Tax=Pistacia vera TaxID=55513 RepID=UPI001262C41A|nr:receptor-like protein 33 [Pistacia vera]